MQLTPVDHDPFDPSQYGNLMSPFSNVNSLAPSNFGANGVLPNQLGPVAGKFTPNLLQVPIPNFAANDETAKMGYNPDPSYITKNWAPNQTYLRAAQSAANAQALAEHEKIISPEIGHYFLANTLAEDRSGNYGLTDPVQIAPDVADKMKINNSNSGKSFSMPAQGDTLAAMSGYNLDKVSTDTNAKLALIMLANKAAATDGSPAKTYTAWNGTGPNAANHWQKVQTIQNMLETDPVSQKLYAKYNEYLNQARQSLENH